MDTFVSRAIETAEKGKGKTEHRPLVGCVIFRGKKIIATGYHGELGRKHAEAIALGKAGKKAPGAEMAVTLEPCSFRGRTGACTDKIIRSGISRVAVGTTDPNPKAHGRGIKKLRKAGIKVKLLRSKEVEKLNERYNKWISTGRPFVLLKIAMSADGFISFGDGKRKTISCGESRKKVQEMRNEFEGILTGIGTVKKDNPRLTCRLPLGRNPVRIVLDPELEISKSARLLGGPGRAIVFYRKGLRSKKKKALGKKAELVPVKARHGLLDLRQVLGEIGKRKIMSVLVEGGQKINTSFLEDGLADRAVFFVSKKKMGKGLKFCRGKKNARALLSKAGAGKSGADTVLSGIPKRIN